MKFLIILLLFMGCSSTSKYEKYYTQSAPDSYPPTEEVIVVDGSPMAKDVYDRYFSDFLVIGSLDYTGQWSGVDGIRDFGKEIGADIALVSANYDRDVVVSDNTSFYGGIGFGRGGYHYGPRYYGGIGYSPTRTYSVKVFDTEVIYLKKIDGRMAPWYYRISDFDVDKNYKDEFTGFWKNQEYRFRVYKVGDEYIGFLDLEDKSKSLPEVEGNKNLSWKDGDIIMRFDAKTKEGFILSASKSPVHSFFKINKFGHLEVDEVASKKSFSFKRD